MATVAIHAVQYLYKKTHSPLQPGATDAKRVRLRILTTDGLDIGDNLLCRAWLIGSKYPGSVVPKWMLDGEHDRRQKCFDQMEAAAFQMDTSLLEDTRPTTWEGGLF